MKTGSLRLATIVAAALLLAACQGDGEPQVAPVAPVPEDPAVPGLQPGSIVLEVPADDDRVRTNAGEKAEGVLRATGVKGALAFGPYMPLKAGSYTLLLEGSSSGPFIADVTGDGGKVHLGGKEFASSPAGAGKEGSLASLEFDVIEDAQAVEFRVLVPEGSDATLRSYKLVVR